jgi:hypothetical protein
MTSITTTSTSTGNEKVCTTCGEPKPKDTEHFYKDSRTSDGLYSECKVCHIKRTAQLRLHGSGSKNAARNFADNLEGRWRAALDAIARTRQCDVCHGDQATINAASGRGHLCRCVYRKIFSDLMDGYRQSKGSAGCRGEITEHHVPGFGGGVSYSRKNEEYVADVELLLKRVAARLDAEYKDIFPHHFAFTKYCFIGGAPETVIMRHLKLGEDWKRRVGVALDRIRATASKSAVELVPYPLFPVREYFNEHLVNTMQSHPDRQRAIRGAVNKEAVIQSAVRYGIR